MSLLSLNPALQGLTGTTVDQTLNLFNPDNGFVKGGSSNYTAEFKRRYEKGVVARNNNIKWAQDRLAAIEAGNSSLVDDESLYITDSAYGVMNNKFFSQDTRYIAHISQLMTTLEKGWQRVHTDCSLGSSTHEFRRLFQSIHARSLENNCSEIFVDLCHQSNFRLSDSSYRLRRDRF